MHNANYLITLAVMMSLGLLIAHLADRLRLQLAKARNSISQMRGMFMLGKEAYRGALNGKTQRYMPNACFLERLGVPVRFCKIRATRNYQILHIITLGQTEYLAI
ncbi:MAG: hypothetical protein U5L01_06050 [Rheinheimera sp.]|nr:hypothetical protein [Rheinheimera sp.]